MSRLEIIKALENGLRSVPDLLPTIWEDETDETVATGPTDAYQITNTLFGEPITNEVSEAQTEQGYYQISLKFPAGQGIGPPTSEADRIQATMKRTGSFESGGIVVHIEKVQMGAKRPDGTHDRTPVLIHFWANVPA